MKHFSGIYQVLLKTSLFLIVGVCLSLSNFGGAHAAPIIFSGIDIAPGGGVPAGGAAETARNDFLSNLVGVGTEDFESFPTGDSVPLTVNFPPAVQATLTTSIGTAQVLSASLNNRFATSGMNYLQVQAGFTITFDQPIAAFGFYGTDIGDLGGQLVLNFDNQEILDVPHAVPADANGSLLFYGIIDTNPFSSVTFQNPILPGFFIDGFGFDDLTIGSLDQVVMENTNTVPEPSTFILLGSGLAGIIGFGRLRKSYV